MGPKIERRIHNNHMKQFVAVPLEMSNSGVGGLDLQYNRLGGTAGRGTITRWKVKLQSKSTASANQKRGEIRANLQEERKRIRRRKKAGNAKHIASLLLTRTKKGGSGAQFSSWGGHEGMTIVGTN